MQGDRKKQRPTSPAARRLRKPRTDPVHMKPLPSDQAPGEETVQVNDQYAGDGPPPPKKPSGDDQHQTGG
ncbi:MAG TPA: hypothetical protein VGG31_01410 [Candidatus Dormibacteraeota bacterium]